jgi:site-specific recombinase XerD
MTIEAYYDSPKMLKRLHEGPLGAHIDLFAARLLREGHCRQGAWRNLRVACDFSHWLARKRLELDDINEQSIEEYQEFRRRYRCPFLSDRPALIRLLGLLREIDAIPAKPPFALDELEQVVQDFDRYLIQERGLARVSAVRHVPFARQFLREHCLSGYPQITSLTGSDVMTFVERHARDHSPQSAKHMCSAIRAFMRFLQYRGYIAADLASCVPGVRAWQLTSLPTYLLPDQVQTVLNGCDRHTPVGRRDYAILLLLARLGLRANEIALLTLDDIDWRIGQLAVHGKGRRRAELPLPAEVGAAMVDYLKHGRPQSGSRRVFLRHLAPHIGFASSAAVSMIATMALTRAGIDNVSHKGAHLFRHSLATQLLRAGASLTQIGQVLRHQDHDTTRIYAKVDIASLRTLGLPWPGGVQ